MAASSIVSLFNVFILISAVSLANGDDNNANVKKTCTGSPFPATCISTLSSYNQSKGDDARTIAGLMVRATMGSTVSASGVAADQKIVHEDLSDQDLLCFTGCSNDMKNAFHKLEAACGDRDIAHVNLADVRTFLKEAKEKHTVWNCDRCRHGEMKKKVDEISMGNEAEKRMAILSVLVNRAMK